MTSSTRRGTTACCTALHNAAQNAASRNMHRRPHHGQAVRAREYTHTHTHTRTESSARRKWERPPAVRQRRQRGGDRRARRLQQNTLHAAKRLSPFARVAFPAVRVASGALRIRKDARRARLAALGGARLGWPGWASRSDLERGIERVEVVHRLRQPVARLHGMARHAAQARRRGSWSCCSGRLTGSCVAVMAPRGTHRHGQPGRHARARARKHAHDETRTRVQAHAV